MRTLVRNKKISAFVFLFEEEDYRKVIELIVQLNFKFTAKKIGEDLNMGTHPTYRIISAINKLGLLDYECKSTEKHYTFDYGYYLTLEREYQSLLKLLSSNTVPECCESCGKKIKRFEAKRMHDTGKPVICSQKCWENIL